MKTTMKRNEITVLEYIMLLGSEGVMKVMVSTQLGCI